MTTGLELRPVRSRAEHRAFVALPYRLYRDDPNWVAPLRIGEARRWNSSHNPALRYRAVERFLAWRGRVAVGRVAAVVDPAFRDRWDPAGGFFGFFETEVDPDVAPALLSAAESWLREVHGVTTVYGPVNLSMHDEVGIVVQGGDRPPMLLSPHTPSHYRMAIEREGYSRSVDLLSYGWSPSAPAHPMMERLRQRVERGGIEVRYSTRERWAVDSGELRDLYNATFADLWGFVPLREDEFRRRAEEFKAFYRPELAAFAEADGVPVGFGLVLPDINVVLKRANGRLWPLGWWHLMRGAPRIRSGRLILLGVLPPYRRTGLAVVLGDALARAGRALGYQYAELSVIQDDNRDIQAVVRALGGAEPVRRYRLYRKVLAE